MSFIVLAKLSQFVFYNTNVILMEEDQFWGEMPLPRPCILLYCHFSITDIARTHVRTYVYIHTYSPDAPHSPTPQNILKKVIALLVNHHVMNSVSLHHFSLVDQFTSYSISSIDATTYLFLASFPFLRTLKLRM